MNIKANLGVLKKHWIPSVSGLVILVCAGAYFLRSEQIQRLELDYDDLNVRMGRILANMRNSDGIDKDVTEAKRLLTDGTARLFTPSELAANQRYFYQLESSTGVQLTNLQQSLRTAEAAGGPRRPQRRQAASKYQELAYEVSLTGTYENVLKFLRELEDGRAFYRLDSFSALQSKTIDDVSIVGLRLSVTILGSKA